MPAEPVSAVSKSKDAEPSPGKAGEMEVGGGGGGEAETAEETGRLLVEFAEHTSLPGVPRVIQAPSRWSRLFWVVVCLACAIAFFVGLSDLLKRYFAYDKKVTVEIRSEPVPFPAVTLCNMRSFDFDFLNRVNQILLPADNSTGQLPDVLALAQRDHGDPFINKYFRFIARIWPLWLEEISRDGDVDVEMERALHEAISRSAMFAQFDNGLVEAGIPLLQYVASCSLGGVPCDMLLDFEHMFHPYYINCYTYRQARQSATSREDQPFLSPGLDNGLSLVVLSGSGMLTRNEEVLIIPGLYDSGSATAASDGVRVIVHAPDVKPLPLAEGYDVPPGFSASIGVRPRQNHRIGPPHGDCVSNSRFDEDDDTAAVSDGYRQLYCQQQCMQNHVEQRCGCRDESMPPASTDETVPLCHATELLPANCTPRYYEQCKQALLKQYHRVRCARKTRDDVRANKTAMAECGCRPACHDLIYDVSYSVSRWPAAGYEGDAVYEEIIRLDNFTSHFNDSDDKLDTITQHFTPSRRELAMTDLARINVYITEPEVTVTTESPDYDMAALVADIGGQLGVWIGLSVITAAELVEILAQAINRRIIARFVARRRQYQAAAHTEPCSA